MTDRSAANRDPGRDDRPAGRRPKHTMFGITFRILLVATLLVAASLAGQWLMVRYAPHLAPGTEPTLNRVVLSALGLYVLLTALPFVPGAEIGLGLIVMLGARIAPFVYGATVLSLTLSFLAGRLIPQRVLVTAFDAVRLRRAAVMMRRLEPLGPQDRLEYFLEMTSSPILPFLLRHRFLALALLLNLPGNVVIGGGGGIGLAAGLSRLFTLPQFVALVAVAVLPVPLIVLLAGR